MNDNRVYLSPAVIDIVTIAQGIFEERICAAMLTAPAEVGNILENWHPEVSIAAKKLWGLVEQGHQYDLVESALKAGMLWDIGSWPDGLTGITAVDLAKASLHRWKCCKAARLGLQAIADNSTIGMIIEKSRWKNVH